MSIENTKSALIKAFTDAALFDPVLAVAWENVAFVPPVGTPWAAVTFVPTQPTVATLGDGGSDMQMGFLQIDLNYPPNDSTKAQDDMIESLRAIYKAGTTFVYGGQVATIRSCGRSQGRVINNYYKVSVTIMFWAHINR
jgi:hypothetical protein